MTATPLELLPTVACQNCSWERRTQRENVQLLVLAARAHVTETDGHIVDWAPASSVRAEVSA